jgi:hypothetical protein
LELAFPTLSEHLLKIPDSRPILSCPCCWSKAQLDTDAASLQTKTLVGLKGTSSLETVSDATLGCHAWVIVCFELQDQDCSGNILSVQCGMYGSKCGLEQPLNVSILDNKRQDGASVAQRAALI